MVTACFAFQSIQKTDCILHIAQGLLSRALPSELATGAGCLRTTGNQNVLPSSIHATPLFMQNAGHMLLDACALRSLELLSNSEGRVRARNRMLRHYDAAQLSCSRRTAA